MLIRILFFVLPITVFAQTFDIHNGFWLSPVNKNLGTQKSFQVGDGVGTDSLEVNIPSAAAGYGLISTNNNGLVTFQPIVSLADSGLWYFFHPTRIHPKLGIDSVATPAGVAVSFIHPNGGFLSDDNKGYWSSDTIHLVSPFGTEMLLIGNQYFFGTITGSSYVSGDSLNIGVNADTVLLSVNGSNSTEILRPDKVIITGDTVNINSGDGTARIILKPGLIELQNDTIDVHVHAGGIEVHNTSTGQSYTLPIDSPTVVGQAPRATLIDGLAEWGNINDFTIVDSLVESSDDVMYAGSVISRPYDHSFSFGNMFLCGLNSPQTTQIGANTFAIGNDNILANVTNLFVAGNSITVGGDNVCGIGLNLGLLGGAVGLGNFNDVGKSSIAIGSNIDMNIATDSFMCIIGNYDIHGSYRGIKNFYFGVSNVAPTPRDSIFFSLSRGQSALPNNKVGSNWIFDSGTGTGNSTSGSSFSFRTSNPTGSGTNEQSLTEKMRITKAGDVAIPTLTKGLILADDAATTHYWRVTVDSTGTLVTTDLGTSIP